MSSSYDELLLAKGFLPFCAGHLTPQMVQKAKEELNEQEKTRTSSIVQLRKLVQKEKNLRCRTDDEFLLQFLRARKFDVKKSFSRLQSMFTVASKTFSDVYANSDVEMTKKSFRSGFGFPLPYRDKEGAAVIFLKMNEWDTESVDGIGILNCSTALVLSAADDPVTQVCGLQVVVDVKGTTFQQVRCLTPRLLYLFSKGLRDSLPVRYKGLHLINVSTMFRYIWAILYVFLTDKMKKRVQIHDDNMDTLHKVIPKEVLPTEYGGSHPNFDPAEWGAKELEKFSPKYFQIIHSGYMKN